ncbi:hypothetical protein SCAR479_12672 [Seiridium cardinale]|uniref:Uncharacterized protein n=1 Tax=Seiridium cardinale TaxID=138064 RepID=A0ABR2XAB0_9PEZI
MSRFSVVTTLILLSCIDPSLAAVDVVNNNFERDFIIGLAVAAAATIAFTILVCTCALCGPRLFGRCCFKGSKHSSENWFDPRYEEKRDQPFVQSSNALIPSYA